MEDLGTPRETRLDPYVGLYASRTHEMKASAVRTLFAVANRPEVVSLAGGMPNISDLPMATLESLCQDVLREQGTKALQYGSGQGEITLREKICQVMQLEGINGSPDDVSITCGSQQGLDLITRVLCDPGDTILAESPSYVGALSTFSSYQVEVQHVDTDEQGLIPSAVKQACIQARKNGRHVKFCYTIPNFNNPSGVMQTLERRKELLAVAHELDLLIVEDNPYGLLNYDTELVPAIRSMDDSHVIYLGSFSKTFAPGFRIGWVLAPRPLHQKLVLAQEAATLCPPVFGQFAIARYLESQPWQHQIEVFKAMYRGRRDTMLATLGETLSDSVTWTEPLGGFFVWLNLPAGVNSESMLARAIRKRVAYTPGTAFYADDQGAQNLRLSFSYPTSERIAEGVRRLASVIREEADVAQTFGLSNDSTKRFPRLGPMVDLQ